MKHAILILATECDSILERLIHRMDDERNDIYLHIDKKGGKRLGAITTSKSHLYYVKRDDLRWGDVSLVKKEIEMIEMCLSNYPYSYIHLVSGSDLPVKSPAFIHDFCSKNTGTEFVAFSKAATNEVYTKAGVFHLFPRQFKNNNILIRIVRSGFVKVQKLFHFERRNISRIVKGPQWFSITGEFGKYIVERKQQVLSRFKNTFCSDELFLQTLLVDSPFFTKVFDQHYEWRGCMRFVKWQKNTIARFDDTDLREAFDADAFFARKFYSEDKALLKKYDELYEQYCAKGK